MDLTNLVEFIGVDVLLLGTMTMLAAHLGIEIWRSAPMQPSTDPNLGWIFRKLLRQLKSVNEEGLLAVMTLVVTATVAGMIANEVSDVVLDSETAERSSERFFWVRDFLKGDEDILRRQALKDVVENLQALPGDPRRRIDVVDSGGVASGSGRPRFLGCWVCRQ